MLQSSDVTLLEPAVTGPKFVRPATFDVHPAVSTVVELSTVAPTIVLELAAGAGLAMPPATAAAHASSKDPMTTNRDNGMHETSAPPRLRLNLYTLVWCSHPIERRLSVA